MPSYYFLCRNCDATVTVTISIKDELKTPLCAQCKAAMVRDYGVGAIKFNGSGWASKEK